jgi:hypothetical protein
MISKNVDNWGMGLDKIKNCLFRAEVDTKIFLSAMHVTYSFLPRYAGANLENFISPRAFIG